ncbi:hypothetical protein C2E23DRAFT_895004 [Lenzites betulinus]|nr:hypothetical protein C2E23DRAFT_895004 [Lenzites betulinus]
MHLTLNMEQNQHQAIAVAQGARRTRVEQHAEPAAAVNGIGYDISASASGAHYVCYARTEVRDGAGPGRRRPEEATTPAREIGRFQLPRYAGVQVFKCPCLQGFKASPTPNARYSRTSGHSSRQTVMGPREAPGPSTARSRTLILATPKEKQGKLEVGPSELESARYPDMQICASPRDARPAQGPAAAQEWRDGPSGVLKRGRTVYSYPDKKTKKAEKAGRMGRSSREGEEGGSGGGAYGATRRATASLLLNFLVPSSTRWRDDPNSKGAPRRVRPDRCDMHSCSPSTGSHRPPQLHSASSAAVSDAHSGNFAGTSKY